MPIHFEDRQAKYPNRWTMKKSDGTSEVVTLIRNDEPIVEGTPMNAETLNQLSDVAGADVARAEAEAAAQNAKDYSDKAKNAAENAAQEAASRVVDPTLTLSGKAADAKATGAAVDKEKERASKSESALEDKKADKTELDTERKRIDTLNDGGLNLKNEVIDTSIKAWLADHPEATTTVQDGAITEGKINAEFLPYIKKDYVTPEMFGAVGDGAADDSEALQKAFDYVTENNLNALYITGFYRCNRDIKVEKAFELTISGLNMNRSRILMAGSTLTIGNDTGTVNELRINNITINGVAGKNVIPFIVKNITNVTFQDCNFAEGGSYLMRFDHADIVFISNCTFAGSNYLDTWLPCSGIEVVSGNPIMVDKCNIWNLNTFIDIKAENRIVSIANSWIEFVIKIINIENLINGLGASLKHNISNCNIAYSPHGSKRTFEDASIINYNNLQPGFNIITTVSNNHIVYYSDSSINHLIHITDVPEQMQIECLNNLLFTPLSTVDAYFVNIDKGSNKSIIFSSLNIDADRGCNIASCVKQIRTTNFMSAQISIPSISTTKKYTLWSGNNRLYFYGEDNIARTIIASSANDTIDNIDASNASVLDVANKLHTLIEVLYRSSIIRKAGD